ncbi:hypothetical protein SGRIM119S_07258 [Streptomyces griseorubiginosus]
MSGAGTVGTNRKVFGVVPLEPPLPDRLPP